MYRNRENSLPFKYYVSFLKFSFDVFLVALIEILISAGLIFCWLYYYKKIQNPEFCLEFCFFYKFTASTEHYTNLKCTYFVDIFSPQTQKLIKLTLQNIK